MLMPRFSRAAPLVGSALAALLLALGLALMLDQLAVRPASPSSPAPLVVPDRRPDGERAVVVAQSRLAASPDDTQAQASLAQAYLLRVRETADPSYYQRAATLLQRALVAQPDNVDGLLAAGGLALARHEFDVAERFGRRVVTQAPERAAGYAVLTDALVELGRYDEAVATAQRLVDLRPNQAAYARVAYLRELHGDLEGAIEAMTEAVQASAPTGETRAWSAVQLGNLHFSRGDLPAAEAAYRDALQRLDGYISAEAGLVRLRAAQGDLAGAASDQERLVQRLPLPELVATLGDLYTRLGETERAGQQAELVEATQRLYAANGVRTDLELAVLQADQGRDLPGALVAAQAEYARRPSVVVADGLAWVAYRAGDLDAALAHSREALRLGSQDPLLLYHAGVIAQDTGDPIRARELLRASAGLNPHYAIRFADDLAARLRQLGDAP